MLTTHALQQAVGRHLHGVGYDQSLIQTDWTPREVVRGGTPVSVPLMAFWGKPFDQFRSAIAVTPKNGTSPNELAKRTVSHVLMCEEDVAELWLLDADDLKCESRVPLSQLEGLFAACRDRIERNNVAETKIRLRQYALYEADPKGDAFGQWAVRPSIDQAGSQLGRLIAAAKRQWSDKNDKKQANWARWLFRVLTLRVGLDRGWSVASGLGREDVSDFVARAADYPTAWHRTALSARHRIDITEKALGDLQHFDFSTVDPLFVSKAVEAASLKHIRSHIDLFPTPKPLAWDMVASIPLTEEVGIYDATAGTGTFLVAAGHSVWANAVGATADLPDLRQGLHGADSSPLSADLAHIALDLAFGYKEGPTWAVNHMGARQAVAALSPDREWLLVGNPPWAVHGSSGNEASEIMSHYVDALAKRKCGWIAIILPRTVLTSRRQRDRQMREKIAANFQLESAWELSFGSIPGGRAQATSIVLSRGRAKTTTVWKQLDGNGVVNTTGYSRTAHSSSFFVSPHGRFVESKFADSRPLSDWFDVKKGVELVAGGRLESPPREGAISFVHLLSQLGDGDGGEAGRVRLGRNEVPESFAVNDAVAKGGWLERNCRRPARAYRGALETLPQIAVPRAVYEGVGNLCRSVAVVEKPTLFSEAFCVLVPRRAISQAFARGVAIVLTSLLGRLWIHLHALSGRHMSCSRLSELPLPPNDRLEHLSGLIGADACKRAAIPAWLFEPRRDFEQELGICSMYGLDRQESAALLALGYYLGHELSDWRALRHQMADTRGDPDRLRRLWDRVGTTEDVHERSQLYVEALAEEEKDDYLVVEDGECQLSIRKSSIGLPDG